MKTFPEMNKVPYQASVIEKTVDDYQRKRMTKITVPFRKRGTEPDPSVPSVSFHIMKQFPALMETQFLEGATDIAVKNDEHGIFMLDRTVLKAYVHMFILENLTTLSLTYKNENGEKIAVDTPQILAFGEYLAENFSSYSTLFESMVELAVDECRIYAQLANSVSMQMLASKVDPSELIRDPNVMKLVKEQLRSDH